MESLGIDDRTIPIGENIFKIKLNNCNSIIIERNELIFYESNLPSPKLCKIEHLFSESNEKLLKKSVRN